MGAESKGVTCGFTASTGSGLRSLVKGIVRRIHHIEWVGLRSLVKGIVRRIHHIEWVGLRSLVKGVDRRIHGEWVGRGGSKGLAGGFTESNGLGRGAWSKIEWVGPRSLVKRVEPWWLRNRKIR